MRQKVDLWLPVSGEGVMRMTANGNGVSFCGDKKCSKINCDDGGTTL